MTNTQITPQELADRLELALELWQKASLLYARQLWLEGAAAQDDAEWVVAEVLTQLRTRGL